MNPLSKETLGAMDGARCCWALQVPGFQGPLLMGRTDPNFSILLKFQLFGNPEIRITQCLSITAVPVHDQDAPSWTWSTKTTEIHPKSSRFQGLISLSRKTFEGMAGARHCQALQGFPGFPGSVFSEKGSRAGSVKG